jgi:bifunctional DNA-binding transcriptional regulator/antitoxin component of YhaV-PrlF toxin-antitoxin module
MEATMQTVRVRDKHQITLPMSIVRAAHIRENDRLSVDYRNGMIIIVTETKEKAPSIRDYIGIAKNTYGKTGEEVNAYISNARDSWER